MKKTGTRKNFTLRILCLNPTIPASEPAGASAARSKSEFSDNLPILTFALSLSQRKTASARIFRPAYITNAVRSDGTAIIV